MSAAGQPRLRTSSPDDTDAILELFESVFGHPRSRDHWLWQYQGSPGGSGLIEVAATDSGIVGCAALMRQDLNSAGRRIPAAQACDGMLDAHYRGHGHYTRLAQQNYAAARIKGVRVVIGFPNQSSFPVLVRELGHERILVLRHYQRRLGGAQIWGRTMDRALRPAWKAPNKLALVVSRRRRTGRLSYTTSEEPHPQWERLLRHSADQEMVSIWKDLDYIRWRYARHPTHRYTFHTLWSDDRPVAVVVARRVEGRAAICELIHPRRVPREAALLLREVVSTFSGDSGCQTVEFFGHDIGFFDAAFQEAGFSRSAHSPLVMIAARLGESELGESLRIGANWTVTYGDTDII